MKSCDNSPIEMGAQAIAEPEVEKSPTTPETALETESTSAPASATTTSTTAQTAPKEPVPARPVGGVEAYKKMMDELKSGKVPEELAKAATEEIPGTETPAPETPAVPETPETPAPAAPVETPPEETPAEVETPPAAEEPTGKEPPNRIRIGRLPEKDRSLLVSATELAAAEGISITAAWSRITGQPETSAPVPSGPQLRSRDDVQKEIAAASAELDAAADDQDNLVAGAAKRMREAQKKTEALKEELGQIDFAEAEAETARENAERTKFQTTVESSQAKAVEYWPESNDPKSVLSKKTIELADAYEKDPVLAHMVSEADSPFYFTSMAAKELGILPAHLRSKTPPVTTTKASTPPTATKPAPVTQRAVGSPTATAATPASGDARTTRETTPDPLGLDKVHNVAEYWKLKGQLTGQRY